jgi:hypothetical protein
MENYTCSIDQNNIKYNVLDNEMIVTLKFYNNNNLIYHFPIDTEFIILGSEMDLMHCEIKHILRDFKDSFTTNNNADIEMFNEYDLNYTCSIVKHNNTVSFNINSEFFNNTFTVIINDDLKNAFTMLYELY